VTALSDLQGCQSTIDSGWSIVAAPLLVSAIDSALGVPAPDGSPAAISGQASAYQKASATCKQVADNLNDVARNKLPAAWRGDVAETASEAVSALSDEATTTSGVLSQAGEALQAWADNLTTAQRNDSSGRGSLQSAKGRLGPLGGWLSSFIELGDMEDFAIAVAEAQSGIASMVSAASLAQNSAEDTSATLNALAGRARASQVNASGLDPLDAVVLATEQNAASDGGGSVLTAAELARASQLLNGMSPAQQRQFEELLADAKSPAEAAYLMKALAAGNSLATIEQFDKLIHPYGNNLSWLSQHLAPDLAQGTYDGQSVYYTPDKQKPGYVFVNPIYTQGGVNDCVAASTVVALANLDPVYMLKLTTGGHPGVPGSDSVTAFTHRLQTAYISNYQQGQRADGDPGVYPKVDGGLASSGENLLANSDLGTATGTSYHYVSLNGSGDNQAILPKVEQTVDSGQPVPIDVVSANGKSAHQMVIIGASGNELEIYNPWGSTHWVTTQQFVNNQLGSAAPGGNMPIAFALEMPS
jgi:uncharacterized protein YukE